MKSLDYQFHATEFVLTPKKLKIIKMPDKMGPNTLQALRAIIMGSNVMFISQVAIRHRGNELILMKVRELSRKSNLNAAVFMQYFTDLGPMF